MGWMMLSQDWYNYRSMSYIIDLRSNLSTGPPGLDSRNSRVMNSNCEWLEQYRFRLHTAKRLFAVAIRTVTYE